MQPYNYQPNQGYQPDYNQGYQPDYNQGYPPQQPVYNQPPGYQGYPPQQPIYNQPPQQPIYNQPPQQTVVVVHNNEDSGKLRCPHCNSSTGFTKTKVIGSAVIWVCFILFLFTFVCCWIACFMEELMDTEVKCANCGAVIKVVPAGEKDDYL